MNKKLGIVFLVLASLAAVLSFYFQWYDEGEFGTECEERVLYDQPCLAPVLRGGFPLAYVIDDVGVSVVGQLTLFDLVDDFLPISFLLDILIYFLLFTGIWYWVQEFRFRNAP